MNAPPPTDLQRWLPLTDLLFQGQKIAAIKLYREETGAGLAEAKAAVEALERELRATYPERFSNPTPPSRSPLTVLLGILAALVLGLILAVLLFMA